MHRAARHEIIRQKEPDMKDASSDRQLHEKMHELDRLIAEFEEQADPAARAAMSRIVQTLLEFHGAGLRRILDRLASQGTSGEELIQALGADGLVASLLVLHDLHPVDVTTRLQLALEEVRPYLASHGGHVELLSVSPEGVVHLRLEGSCHGCPSSRITLQTTIEQKIYSAAPEVTSIVVDGLVDPPPPAKPDGFVPVDRLAIHGNVGLAAS
jgi:Fe-S cluster biogenesis protein NfuA